MDEKYLAAQNVLKKHQQEQILNNYEKMSDEEKKNLLDQILTINMEQISDLYKNTQKEISFANDKIEPIEYIDKSKLSDEEFSKYEKLGTDAIKAGKYAVVTMAGGQGTRLGHNDSFVEKRKSLDKK